jgi:hypothetical protein
MSGEIENANANEICDKKMGENVCFLTLIGCGVGCQ